MPEVLLVLGIFAVLIGLSWLFTALDWLKKEDQLTRMWPNSPPKPNPGIIKFLLLGLVLIVLGGIFITASVFI